MQGRQLWSASPYLHYGDVRRYNNFFFWVTWSVTPDLDLWTGICTDSVGVPMGPRGRGGDDFLEVRPSKAGRLLWITIHRSSCSMLGQDVVTANACVNRLGGLRSERCGHFCRTHLDVSQKQRALNQGASCLRRGAMKLRIPSRGGARVRAIEASSQS